MKWDEFRETLKEKILYWNQDVQDKDVFDFTENDLAEYLENNDSFKLYRYMPPEYYNIRNIETQKIHLSNNGVMNDLYDGLPALSEANINVNAIGDLAVMTCFSETNTNTLMWSHYASSHKGFCVEYDLKRFIEDPLEIKKHLFPIVYTEERLIQKNIDSIIESMKELRRAIDEHIVYDGSEVLDDILPLFLTKGNAWEYEREWRIIYTKKQIYEFDDDALYSGSILFNCISAIYLGYRIDVEKRNHILEICNRINTLDNSIRVYQEKLDKTGYNIQFEELVHREG